MITDACTINGSFCYFERNPNCVFSNINRHFNNVIDGLALASTNRELWYKYKDIKRFSQQQNGDKVVWFFVDYFFKLGLSKESKKISCALDIKNVLKDNTQATILRSYHAYIQRHTSKFSSEWHYLLSFKKHNFPELINFLASHSDVEISVEDVYSVGFEYLKSHRFTDLRWFLEEIVSKFTASGQPTECVEILIRKMELERLDFISLKIEFYLKANNFEAALALSKTLDNPCYKAIALARIIADTFSSHPKISKKALEEECNEIVRDFHLYKLLGRFSPRAIKSLHLDSSVKSALDNNFFSAPVLAEEFLNSIKDSCTRSKWIEALPTLYGDRAFSIRAVANLLQGNDKLRAMHVFLEYLLKDTKKFPHAEEYLRELKLQEEEMLSQLSPRSAAAAAAAPASTETDTTSIGRSARSLVKKLSFGRKNR